MDARDFVRKIFYESAIPVSQVVMNLPASAELFLGNKQTGQEFQSANNSYSRRV